ncbi:sugar phosphate isomerase/epimerase family protein [Fodinicola acaciae]|uniref:sugar phosphate isomerase/epimerase family protein n=1 Tax=Fodinicola acaciae TaxID=2681555 RepID=UPI0013D85352|nr:sugar phosphate isomerase/epimerase [Fodinicola acaciae]
MASPLSVQLYTLRDQMATDRDGGLRRLAEIGFGAVEPYDPTADPRGFREVADDLGLAVTGTHAYALLREPDRANAVLDDVATIGASLAIIPGGIEHEKFTSVDGLREVADLLNGIAEKTAPYDIKLGYHNHWWEIEPTIDGRHAIEVLADLLAPGVVLEIDTYWAAVGGADVPALLGKLGDRVVSLHVKDGPVRKGEPHVAVGTGAMPVPQILAAAPNATRIVEFDECATDIFTALKESRDYLIGLEEA